MWKKLCSQTAETLLETLVSLLIAVFSVTLLTSGVMTATRLNRATDDADTSYQAELKQAETEKTVADANGKVTITFQEAELSAAEADVVIYGTGAYASYEKKEATEP